MTALTAPVVRQPRHVQSAAERQQVYWEVTDRDEAAAPSRHGCRALDIDPDAGPCDGPIQRHHAGIKIGTRRVTARDRVVCLCDGHHQYWAPTHNRAILEWLADLDGPDDLIGQLTRVEP